ncbi:MAG: hypothetical protein C4317_01910 [Acidimicrobiia bacterium]
MQYAELHCHSNFSFLDGVSDPAKLVEQAAQLGYCGLAITDHNGLPTLREHFPFLPSTVQSSRFMRILPYGCTKTFPTRFVAGSPRLTL